MLKLLAFKWLLNELLLETEWSEVMFIWWFVSIKFIRSFLKFSFCNVFLTISLAISTSLEKLSLFDQQISFSLKFLKPLSYCFEETIWFDVKDSFASRPVSRLIKWYNKPGDKTKEILRKGYSVPWDFSWIENYKLHCGSIILLFFCFFFLRKVSSFFFCRFFNKIVKPKCKTPFSKLLKGYICHIFLI